MDTLMLPEEGWAYAYPDPRQDQAHLVHSVCGWRTAQIHHIDALAWYRESLIETHQCTQGGGSR